MRNLIHIVLLSFIPSILYCQEWGSQDSVEEARGRAKEYYVAINIEMTGGAGALLAWSFDVRFLRNFSLKLGYAAYAEDKTPAGTLDAHMGTTSAQYLFFDGENHLEIGAGALFLLNANLCFEREVMPNKCNTLVGTAFIGWRHQAFSAPGFVFRIGYIPFFNSEGYIHRGGFSLGLNLL